MVFDGLACPIVLIKVGQLFYTAMSNSKQIIVCAFMIPFSRILNSTSIFDIKASKLEAWLSGCIQLEDKKYIVKEFIEQGIATKTNYTNKKTGYSKHILSRLMGEAIHKRMCLSFLYYTFPVKPHKKLWPSGQSIENSHHVLEDS